MAKAPTLTDITTSNLSTTQLNSNFEAIETAFLNTLSLDGSTPNAMEADLDLNGNDIINVGDLNVSSFTIGGEQVDLSIFNSLSSLGEDIVTLSAASSTFQPLVNNLTQITTLVNNINSINSVAGISSQISVLSANDLSAIANSIDDIRTVADFAPDIGTIADIVTDLNTAEGNITTLTDNLDTLTTTVTNNKTALDNAILTEQNARIAALAEVELDVSGVDTRVTQVNNTLTTSLGNLEDDIDTLNSSKVSLSDYNITVDYQQQLNDDIADLEAAALQLVIQTSTLNTRFNDAGITVDPSTGTVTIEGISSVEDRISTVETDLNAVESSLTLKASTAYVNNAIAAAQLPEATLAELDDLTARVDTAEVDINALDGAIRLTSTGLLYDINDGELGVEAIKGEIEVLQGQIVLKASQTDLDAAESRLTTAEVNISAIDAPAISLAVQDVREFGRDVDDLSELSLQEALARYGDRQFNQADIATVRTELEADVTDLRTADASIRTDLGARIDSTVASIQQEATARADGDSAITTTLNELQAIVEDPDTGFAAVQSSLQTVETTTATALDAFSSQLTTLESTVNNPTTGLAATRSTLETQYRTEADTDTAIANAIAVVNASIGGVETDVAANTTAISNVSSRVTTAEGNITSISSDITTLEASVTSATDEVSGLSTAVDNLTTEVNTVEGNIAVVSQDVTDLTASLALTDSNVSSNASALSALDTRVTTAEGTITSQSSDITTLQSDLDQAELDIVANASATSALDTRVTAAEGTITSQSSAITTLQSELDTAESNITANASATTALTTRVTTAEGNISTISSDVSTLSTTVGENTASITTQASSIDGLEAQYGVTIDNNGVISGFQLLSGAGTPSAFNIRADQFSLFSTDGTVSQSPFTVYTTERTVDGVTLPAGVYISSASIETLTADKLTTGTLNAERIQLDNTTLSSDGSGNLVVKTGGISSNQVATEAVTKTVIETEAGPITPSSSGDGSVITALSAPQFTNAQNMLLNFNLIINMTSSEFFARAQVTVKSFVSVGGVLTETTLFQNSFRSSDADYTVPVSFTLDVSSQFASNNGAIVLYVKDTGSGDSMTVTDASLICQLFKR